LRQKPNNAGAQCDPGVTNCITHQVDVAFVRLSAKVTATRVDQIGTVTGVSKKTDLNPKQSIELNGQATGTNNFKLAV